MLDFPNTAEVLDGAHRLTSVFVTQFVDEVRARTTLPDMLAVLTEILAHCDLILDE